jgi:hypothetical protein
VAGQQSIYRTHDDPELFALVNQALEVVDPAEREKVLNRTYRRLRMGFILITPGHVNISWGVGPRIQTRQPCPMALYVPVLRTITLE